MQIVEHSERRYRVFKFSGVVGGELEVFIFIVSVFQVRNRICAEI